MKIKKRTILALSIIATLAGCSAAPKEINKVPESQAINMFNQNINEDSIDILQMKINKDSELYKQLKQYKSKHKDLTTKSEGFTAKFITLKDFDEILKNKNLKTENTSLYKIDVPGENKNISFSSKGSEKYVSEIKRIRLLNGFDAYDKKESSIEYGNKYNLKIENNNVLFNYNNTDLISMIDTIINEDLTIKEPQIENHNLSIKFKLKNKTALVLLKDNENSNIMEKSTTANVTLIRFNLSNIVKKEKEKMIKKELEQNKTIKAVKKTEEKIETKMIEKTKKDEKKVVSALEQNKTIKAVKKTEENIETKMIEKTKKDEKKVVSEKEKQAKVSKQLQDAITNAIRDSQ